MTRRERIEDLGIIYQRLRSLLIDFEEDYPYFDSKHSYELFESSMLAKDKDKLYDMHVRLRFMIDELNEIVSIAHGDTQE